jgi:hypothetical protein
MQHDRPVVWPCVWSTSLLGQRTQYTVQRKKNVRRQVTCDLQAPSRFHWPYCEWQQKNDNDTVLENSPQKNEHMKSFAFHVQHEQRQWVTHNTKTIQSVSNQESCLPRQMNIDIWSKGFKKQQPGIRKNSHMCLGLRLAGDHHSNLNEAPLVDPQKGPRNR